MKHWKEEGFTPIKEGGYCRRIYTGPSQHGRPLATAIDYWLPAGGCSAPHSLDADELWLHLGGGDVELIRTYPDGSLSRITLCPGGHYLLPAGCIFAARERSGQGAKISCVVIPGYEDAGLRLYTSGELEGMFPGSEKIWMEFMEQEALDDEDR